MFVSLYGVDYIGHPRFENLMLKNSITAREFLNGKEGAAAFESKEFVRLHQSTLRKVDVLANLAGRAHTSDLKTSTC